MTLKISTLLKGSLTALIACSAASAWALPENFFTTTSKLSSGKWVKFHVPDSGIYEISYSQLSALGFTDPSKVGVFGTGGAIIPDNVIDSDGNPVYNDDLAPVAICRDGDRIIFYAQGPNKLCFDTAHVEKESGNVYSSDAYYFLSDSQDNVLTISTKAVSKPTSETPVTQAMSWQYWEEDNFWYAHSGEDYFGWDFQDDPNNTLTFNYNLPGAVAGSTCYVSLRGGANAKTGSNIFSVLTGTNGEETTITNPWVISPISSNVSYYYTSSLGEPSSRKMTLPDATGTLALTYNTSSDITKTMLDYVVISANRNLEFQSGEKQIHVMTPDLTSRSGCLQFTNIPDNFTVWDVRSSNEVYQLPSEIDGTTAQVWGATTAMTNGELIAFNAKDSFKTVSDEDFTTVENQNLHAIGTDTMPAMVIITTSAYKEKAEELAELHRIYQHENVAVVLTSELINEFSAGTPDPSAYRMFAKMLYERDNADNRTFSSILLYGPMRDDNRQRFSAKADQELLLCKQTPNSSDMTLSFSMTDFYGQLQDQYTIKDQNNNIYTRNNEVAVGVLPVRSTGDCNAINAKIASWLTDTSFASWVNETAYTCDGGDGNEHQSNTEEIVNTWSTYDRGDFIHRKLYNNCYPASVMKKLFMSSISDGTAWQTYVGHGSTVGLTSIWNLGDAQKLNNNHLGFMNFAACTVTNFDEGGRGSAEEMVFVPEHGLIGALLTNRTVLSKSNMFLIKDVTRASLLETPYTTDLTLLSTPRTFGEVVRLAKNKNTRSNANKLGYVLMCDPGLIAPLPTADIKVTVNGKETSDAINVTPLTEIEVNGTIESRDGKAMSNFTGTAVAKVCAAPIVIDTRSDGASDVMSITHDETVLSLVPVEVNEGKFSVKLMIPATIGSEGETAKIRFSAFDNTTRRVAVGTASLAIQAIDEDKAVADTEAPVIESMYVNTPEFNSGDAVGTDSNLFIHITDDNVLMVNSSGTNGSLYLTIDNNLAVKNIAPYVSVENGAKELTVKYPMKDYAVGTHSASIVAIDGAGNTSSATIYFHVESENANATALSTESEVVRKSALLKLTTEAPTDGSQGYTIDKSTLLIVDSLGNEVFKKDLTGNEYEWEATDATGARVPEGVYYAMCRFTTTGGANSITSPMRLVVVRAAK